MGNSMRCLSGKRIHGRGLTEAVYIPNLLPSLWFLRLVIFFPHYHWLLWEQLFHSLCSELPPSFWQTGWEAPIQGWNWCAASREGCSGPGDLEEVQVQTQSGISLDGARMIRSAYLRQNMVPIIIYLSVQLFVIFYHMSRHNCLFWVWIPIWQPQRKTTEGKSFLIWIITTHRLQQLQNQILID